MQVMVRSETATSKRWVPPTHLKGSYPASLLVVSAIGLGALAGAASPSIASEAKV